MKVLNFGSLNLDYVYSVPHIVKPGETMTSNKLEVFPGGKGLNQSIALARAGMDVYQAGAIGEDGKDLLQVCKENNVNTDFIRISPLRTGNAIIQVDEEGPNCIILFPGANRDQNKEFIDHVIDNFSAGDVIVLQNEINLIDYIIDRAYSKGMIIVLNPSPYDDKIKNCDLSKVDYFLMNEIEGEMITGESDPDEILSYMLTKYPNSKVVLTLGKMGSVYADKSKKCKQGIYPVKAVDTTAAGDTFTGYFLRYVFIGESVEKALDMASLASSIAVSRKGASVSIPYNDELLNIQM